MTSHFSRSGFATILFSSHATTHVPETATHRFVTIWVGALEHIRLDRDEVVKECEANGFKLLWEEGPYPAKPV